MDIEGASPVVPPCSRTNDCHGVIQTGAPACQGQEECKFNITQNQLLFELIFLYRYVFCFMRQIPCEHLKKALRVRNYC